MTDLRLACYVINLDGSTQRFEQISATLNEIGIEFQRFSAFDGRKLRLADVADYDQAAAKRYMGRDLVGGEIGCYYSHLNVARAFLVSDMDYCFVIEDDAAPNKNLKRIVEETICFLAKHDPDWRIVNLGNEKMKIFKPIHEIDGGEQAFKLCAAYYFPMTTSAILWSRKGAQEFVANHDMIFSPVDNFLRHWITRAGGGYSFFPRPVATTDAESDIIHSTVGRRSRNSRSVFYGLCKQRRSLTDKLIASVSMLRDFNRKSLKRVGLGFAIYAQPLKFSLYFHAELLLEISGALA